MGALEQAIEKAIEAHVDRLRLAQIITGTATKVSETTCTVTREDAPDLTDVRLNAIDDDLQSFFTVYPKENSSVVVGILEGIKTEAVVLRCSEVERVSLKIGDITLIIKSDGVVFNGGSNGLVKINELINWMASVKTDLTTISTAMQGLGVPIVVTTATPTKTNFEDVKIKH